MLYVSVSRFGELQAIVARIVTPIQRLHELFFEFLRLVVASGASCLATPLSGLWICVFEVPVTPALIDAVAVLCLPSSRLLSLDHSILLSSVSLIASSRCPLDARPAWPTCSTELWSASWRGPCRPLRPSCGKYSITSSGMRSFATKLVETYA